MANDNLSIFKIKVIKYFKREKYLLSSKNVPFQGDNSSNY